MADRYHNPDPLIQLIGPVNESMVILEGKEYPALLDSGAQPSGISLKLAKKFRLKIYQLDTLLDIEGFGENDVPYLGYVEARLQVKGISGMDKDSLFLVVPDSNYTKKSPYINRHCSYREMFTIVEGGRNSKSNPSLGNSNLSKADSKKGENYRT